MKLPNEILYIIFDYMKDNNKKTIYHYGLVCQLWYKMIHHPKYYATIHIHSYSQLLLFLKWQSIHFYNDQPLSYFIKHIKLTFHDIVSFHHMSQLQLVCPFLLTIDYIPSKKTTYPILNQWKHLIHLPLWHSESLSHCIQLLGHQLISLHTFITSSSSSSSSSSSFIPPFQLFPFLKVKPFYYLHLKELYLDNDFSIYEHGELITKKGMMNQSILELIHEKCPVLKKLKIQHIHLLYDPFYFSSSSSSIIQPHPLLTHLELNYLYIIHPEFFCYLFKKFPSLTHFKMIFYGDASHQQSIETKSILMDTLMDGFLHLMSCDILFHPHSQK